MMMFQKNKTESREYIIVAGCGRLGAHLANMLSREEKNIVVIDHDADAFQKLSNEFSGFTMEGNVVERDTLIHAKIDKADAVVITTGDDNTNIMIAQVAKEIYRVQKVIARLYEPTRQKVYEELNIETICPNTLSAVAFTEMLMSKEKEHD